MSLINDQYTWYALQVRPKREKLVAEVLTRKNYEMFLPLVHPDREDKKGRDIRTKPLFPGYLFCRANFFDRRVSIVTTPGVVRFVGTRSGPLPVDEHGIESLRRIVNSPLEYQPIQGLQPGERVQIVGGPLTGVVGNLCKTKPRRRFALNLTILNRSVTVDVQPEWLVPADELLPDGLHALARRARLCEYLSTNVTDCTLNGAGEHRHRRHENYTADHGLCTDRQRERRR